MFLPISAIADPLRAWDIFVLIVSAFGLLAFGIGVGLGIYPAAYKAMQKRRQPAQLRSMGEPPKSRWGGGGWRSS